MMVMGIVTTVFHAGFVTYSLCTLISSDIAITEGCLLLHMLAFLNS